MTRILLDSHTLVWFVAGHERCSPAARAAIADPASTVFVSAASLWEIATKHRLGKWPDAGPFIARHSAVLGRYRFRSLPITLEHGRVAGMLPASHKDPFDRMLAAQAKLENLLLVTADAAFKQFDLETLW